MKSGYALHPEAFADLDDIRKFIAEANPDAADRVISEIFDKIRGLVSFPHQGHQRSDLSRRAADPSLYPVDALRFLPRVRDWVQTLWLRF